MPRSARSARHVARTSCRACPRSCGATTSGDQRASNSWQLALIGLRDAGWRTTSSEAPREFARRVGIDGLERCATILERVRHGVRLDAGDLDEMGGLADAAYASARSRTAWSARALSWLRWPLT
jgi:hypothetical protein